MSTENDDTRLSGLPELPAESKEEYRKLPKFSYTRDFLLSLSELDICKKLHVGLDPSILSEFEDSLSSTAERQRNLGGLSLQSSKRVDYVPAIPSRLEGSSNYPRGSHGKWDTHSSGSSDRDGEAYSDRESFTQDPGRRYVNQSRRSSQLSEHDGLLGSGAFPRPSGYAGGVSASKAHGNSNYQLSRSAEPYQPPRPYKAVPCSRKDSDSLNDETFGSSECSSEDRAENERKRRASFDLMRKEQHKVLQEKKQIPDKRKENSDTDIRALLETSEDARVLTNPNNNKSEDAICQLVPENDNLRCSLHIQAPASRPLVPPGFASTFTEKNSIQSPNTSLASEAENAETNDNPLLTRVTPAANGTEKQKHEFMNVVSLSDVSQTIGAPKLGLEVADLSVHFSNMTSNDESAQGVVIDFDNKKVAGSDVTNSAIHDHSKSILEKLFGNALTKTGAGSPSFVQHQGIKDNEETWDPTPSQSSKFARWFHEEEKKPNEDIPSRDLFSLIVNNDRSGSQVTKVSTKEVLEQMPLIFSSDDNETTQKHLTSTATPIVGISEPYYPSNKLDATTGVLTCKDLEQSILAEVKESTSNLQHSVQLGPPLNAYENPDLQKADVDDRASQHLLSLLQKGTSSKDVILSPELDATRPYEKLGVSDVRSSIPIGVAENASAGIAEAVHSSERSLTLEALFGTAFMKELHSVEAPVSVQRGSAIVDDFFSSMSNENGSKTTHEGNMSSVNSTEEAKPHRIHEPNIGFEDSQIVSSNHGDAVGFEEGPTEIQLPEEDSLITINDAVNPVNLELLTAENASTTRKLLTPKAPEEIVDKLAALNAFLINERDSVIPGLDGPSPLTNRYDMVDSELTYHQRLHGRPSPQQFSHHQMMNHMRPLLQQLDHHAYRNPQMNFIDQQSLHRDPHHSFPQNIIHHHPFQSSRGPQQFDAPVHLPVLQQQTMSMPRNNFPHHQLLQGFPRSAPLSHHTMNHMPEMNPTIQSFPMMNHRLPNHGGVGMGPPGPGAYVGGGGPEALERLAGMELRASSKLAHPGHPISGIYGTELLDMGGFRYR